MEWLSSPEIWAALLTLTFLEIVLGIDNIVFIAILVGKLPEHQRERARKIGLSLAVLTRVALLFSIVWVMQLTEPLFSIFSEQISGRDLILIAGGLFLLGKSTFEIHDKLEGEANHGNARSYAGFMGVIVQIIILDIVFSLDSVITAVGMAEQVWVMVTAILIGAAFMIWSARAISAFIERHPTVKMLALSFLLLIGLALVAEGLDFHIPKGYIYFAMGFSVFVEFLNFKLRKPKTQPVNLRSPYQKDPYHAVTDQAVQSQSGSD